MTLQAPGELDYDGLDYLGEYIYQVNEANGFHDESKFLKRTVKGASSDRTLAIHTANLHNYFSTKLMLIAGEAAEAQEELRHGHGITERYYSTPANMHVDDDGNIVPKPEGVPSELADILIRVLDLAREFDIDLPKVIQEKLAFNATRGYKHGKKF